MPPTDAGFGRVTQFAEARQHVRDHCQSHERVEIVPVADARDRTAAESVLAPRPVPHYERAATDGFAVRAADTVGASDRSPVRLEEATDSVETATGARVHTGSTLPPDADAVVPVEHVDSRMEGLAVYDAVAEGENVAPVGADIEEGAQLLAPGNRIAPTDQALVRAAGFDDLPVAERPRVSVVPTGSALVDADPDVGETVETTGLLVSSLAEQWGGTATYRDIVPDDAAALREAIERDCDHDIVVTTGAATAGDSDHAPAVVDDVGDLLFHGVSLQPGGAVALGVVSGTPVLALPGQPVATLVAAVQFLRPALAWLSGSDPRPHPTVEAQLAGKLPSEPGKRTLARITLTQAGDGLAGGPGWRATPRQVAGTGGLSSLAAADGWVEIGEKHEGVPAGETVTVQQWNRAWRP